MECGPVDNPTLTEIALGVIATFIAWIVKLHNARIDKNTIAIGDIALLIKTIQTEQTACKAEMTRRLERGDACFDCLEEKIEGLNKSSISLETSISDLRGINDTLASNIRKLDDRMWEESKRKGTPG